MAGFFQSLDKPYFIAEIGVNHNGDVNLAKQMVDAAIDCGASVVKFQTFKAENESCKEGLSAPHCDERLGVDGTMFDLLKKLELTPDMHHELLAYCKEKNVTFISTPFSFIDCDLLVSLDVPLIKISSTDVNNLPFLEYLAQTGKPLILSTGMATMEEVRTAVQTLKDNGNKDLAILHCVSLYPPEAEELNLKAITALKKEFPDTIIGFSDHTIGSWASLAAVTLGAEIIEKHFTLDKKMAGPDQAVSADPTEMKQIISEGRLIRRALGTEDKVPSERELEMIPIFRRSIVSINAIPAGTVIERSMIDFKRPATGVPPNILNSVLGKKAVKDIPEDSPIMVDMLQ